MKRFRRILFNTLTAISLLLAIATAALWVRSLWAGDLIYWYGRIYEVSLSSTAGRVRCSLRRSRPGDPPPPAFGFAYEHSILAELRRWVYYSPYSLSVPERQWSFDFAGVTWEHEWEKQKLSSVRLSVHCSVVVIGGALLPLYWSGRRLLIHRRLQRHPGHCPACGYDMRANPAKCSECGHEPSPTTT